MMPGGGAAGDPERVAEPAGICPGGDPDGEGGCERAEDRGRVEARFVDRLRRDEAEPAKHLHAGRHAEQDALAGKLVALGRGENGGHDHRARMDRAAFERVVVILAMRRRAVEERRICRGEPVGMADGDVPAALCCLQHASHVIRVPGREAEPDHVDEDRLRLGRHSLGHIGRAEPCTPFGQPGRNSLTCHEISPEGGRQASASGIRPFAQS